MTDDRPQTDILASVLQLSAKTYHRLRAGLDDLHSELALTAGMRGLLMLLYNEPPTTMSGLAARRGVSRQLIHRLVVQLLEMGLVEQHPNPRHKTSPIVTLSDRGRVEAEKILERESGPLAVMSEGLNRTELLLAERVLEEVAERVAEANSRGRQGSVLQRNEAGHANSLEEG